MLVPASLLKWQNTVSEIILGSPGKDCREGLLLYREGYQEKFQRRLQLYFPTLAPLLGEDVWQREIADPFIKDNPPQMDTEHWVCKLPGWLIQNQKNKLSPIILPLAELENLINKVLLSPSFRSPLKEEIATAKFFLQPHLHFFSSEYPLLTYRHLLLTDCKNVVIEKGEEKWIALSLNSIGDTVLRGIGPEEKEFLEAFNGRTLMDAFCHIDSTNRKLLTCISPKIGEWTSSWIKMGWLGIESS